MFFKIARSFSFAFNGLVYCLKTQRNMKIHFLAALTTVLLAYLWELPKVEFLFVLLAVALVWLTELINTSLEKVVDIITPEFHPLAETAKNVAAGAVLVSALFAVAVGILVFGEKLLIILTKN